MCQPQRAGRCDARAPDGHGTGHVAYNYLFRMGKSCMEAEQVNLIANTLADLAQRTGELRRYL